MKSQLLFLVSTFIFLIFSCSIVGCGNRGKLVTAAEFGDKWPLTVDRGYVYSVGMAAIFETTDGTKYALNGFASSNYGYPYTWDIQLEDKSHLEKMHPIDRENFKQSGQIIKMDTSDLLKLALETKR